MFIARPGLFVYERAPLTLTPPTSCASPAGSADPRKTTRRRAIPREKQSGTPMNSLAMETHGDGLAMRKKATSAKTILFKQFSPKRRSRRKISAVPIWLRRKE